jgi:hypothetical protein
VDTYSEELAFSNSFMGSGRPENHVVKIQYSEIVKSELRKSDGRVTRCVDHIFFKLKKEMQAIGETGAQMYTHEVAKNFVENLQFVDLVP